MDTWSPRGAGLVLKPWKTPRKSRACREKVKENTSITAVKVKFSAIFFFSSPTTVYFIRVVLAVWLTVTKRRDGNTLFSSPAGEVARLAVMHRHLPTTRGRRGDNAGSHRLICTSRRRCSCKQRVLPDHVTFTFGRAGGFHASPPLQPRISARR